ncbi:MAG: ABC transporter ATP-binding protein [Rhizobiaceae bacterium]|nr:ABC transporter ATP-binding protein [Rhizobiaceae bacterium]
MHSPAKPPVVSVRNLRKTYQNGFDALKGVDLDIQDGEILALLGPNGAGKTTLISVICGLVNPTGGSVTVGGHDIITGYRAARSLIGLVPQEMHVDGFESVWASVSFSRGLFGKKRNDAVVEQVLGDLSLLDKKNEKIIALSGGMKRRVMIAKALVHEPRILFLDEPTAGVDVELRKSMWELIRRLNRSGVTIILTTHYIEEAEQIADRVGVINKGELLLVEAKADLMRKMGEKVLTIELRQPIDTLPGKLARDGLVLNQGGGSLTYRYDVNAERTGISTLLSDLRNEGIAMRDISTHQNSLEDIFVSLVRKDTERETAQ